MPSGAGRSEMSADCKCCGRQIDGRFEHGYCGPCSRSKSKIAKLTVERDKYREALERIEILTRLPERMQERQDHKIARIALRGGEE